MNERVQDWIGEEAAAKWLGVSRITLRRWRLDKCGPPYYRLGPGNSPVRYQVVDLARYVAERMESGES